MEYGVSFCPPCEDVTVVMTPDVHSTGPVDELSQYINVCNMQGYKWSSQCGSIVECRHNKNRDLPVKIDPGALVDSVHVAQENSRCESDLVDHK